MKSAKKTLFLKAVKRFLMLMALSMLLSIYGVTQKARKVGTLTLGFGLLSLRCCYESNCCRNRP